MDVILEQVLPLGICATCHSACHCWFGIVFFYCTIWVSIVRISHFMIPIWYEHVMVLFFTLSIDHARIFIPRYNCSSINMVQNGINP